MQGLAIGSGDGPSLYSRRYCELVCLAPLLRREPAQAQAEAGADIYPLPAAGLSRLFWHGASSRRMGVGSTGANRDRDSPYTRGNSRSAGCRLAQDQTLASGRDLWIAGEPERGARLLDEALIN